MNTLRTFAHTLLLATLLPTTACAQEGGTSAKEENPGYFHGGLNLQLSSVRRSVGSVRPRVSRPGIILGLGSEFFFGNYVAERFRFGMNMGWFSLDASFGDGVTSVALQTLKPGFLFSAKASEKLRVDFKYSLLPTIGANIFTDDLDDADGNFFWGTPHGPYLGITYGKFMAGLEYMAGTLHVIEDDDSNLFYDRYAANTLRVLVGINY